MLDITPPVRLTVFTIGQLLLSGFVVLLTRKLKVFNIDDFKLKGIVKGFLLAWFGFVYIAVSFVITLMSNLENSFIAPNIFYLLIVVLHPFIGTGLFEEVLYRGLVLKLLLKYTGSSKREIVSAVVISSTIFGLLHAVNIIAGAPVLPTISQIISATATGLFFAVVYLRTKILWIPIFFHGLLNLSVQIFDAIISPVTQYQTAESQSGAQVGMDITGFIIMTLLSTLPILIAALILLRKVKPEEVETLVLRRT